MGKRHKSEPEGALSHAPVLLHDVRDLILAARAGVARTIDSGLVLLYWQIGQRIRLDVLNEKRAEYGKEIVVSLGRQLEQGFGRGFSDKSHLF